MSLLGNLKDIVEEEYGGGGGGNNKTIHFNAIVRHRAASFILFAFIVRYWNGTT